MKKVLKIVAIITLIGGIILGIKTFFEYKK